MYNRIILVGNLGGDVTENVTGTGTQMASFSVATNRKWKDQKETTWFRVTVFGRQAETCAQYLSRGSQVLVEGRLRPDADGNPRIWERNDGTPAASFEITADNVRFLSGGERTETIEDTSDGIPF
jgi:single-strand DNA-binding protein